MTAALRTSPSVAWYVSAAGEVLPVVSGAGLRATLNARQIERFTAGAVVPLPRWVRRLLVGARAWRRGQRAPEHAPGSWVNAARRRFLDNQMARRRRRWTERARAPDVAATERELGELLEETFEAAHEVTR